VTIDTVVRMRLAVDDEELRAGPPDSLPVDEPATDAEPAAATGNLIKNPGFETGHLKPWSSCHSGSALGGSISKIAHSGKHAACGSSSRSPRKPS
jgi:hypothetical protein